MERTDFERQINALIPRPDPETTADLFAFGQELGETAECYGVRALLTSLQFIARNFDRQTLQGAYEIIQNLRMPQPNGFTTGLRRCPVR